MFIYYFTLFKRFLFRDHFQIVIVVKMADCLFVNFIVNNNTNEASFAKWKYLYSSGLFCRLRKSQYFYLMSMQTNYLNRICWLIKQHNLTFNNCIKATYFMRNLFSPKFLVTLIDMHQISLWIFSLLLNSHIGVVECRLEVEHFDKFIAKEWMFQPLLFWNYFFLLHLINVKYVQD